MREMPKSFILLTLFFACTLLHASETENIVVIDSPNLPGWEVYGAWLSDQVVITDELKLKVNDRPKITFYKGTKKELTLQGKVIWSSMIAVITLEDASVKLPEGMKVTTKPLDVGLAVKLWSYDKGFSSIETEIESINQKKNFQLPGYLDNTTGSPVTDANGDLTGVVVKMRDDSRVLSTVLIKGVLSGIVASSSMSFLNISQDKLSYKCKIKVFDPLSRLDKMVFIYWTGYHYYKRKTESSGYIGANMPGDDIPITIPMTKLNSNEYEVAFNLNIPFDKTAFYSFGIPTKKGGIKYLFTPTELVSYRIFAATIRKPKEVLFYKKERKHPENKDITNIKPPQKAINFPVLDWKKVSPQSLFPFHEGNEWTYERRNTNSGYGKLSGGSSSAYITSTGQKRTITRRSYSGSNHDETYRIHKVVGDQAWLKVYTSKPVKDGLLRDGRYEEVEESILRWNSLGFYAELNEILKGRTKEGAYTKFRSLAVMNTIQLKSKGGSATTAKEQPNLSFSWNAFDKRLDTYIGTFHSYLSSTEEGNLGGGYKYTLTSYYYPNVGLIKEVYEIHTPTVLSNGELSWKTEKSYELNLKAYNVFKNKP